MWDLECGIWNVEFRIGDSLADVKKQDKGFKFSDLFSGRFSGVIAYLLRVVLVGDLVWPLLQSSDCQLFCI